MIPLVIPEDKSAAVARGLRQAFGAEEFEDIRMLTKGQSGALVYRIIVGGSPYLLRIITRTQDPTLPQHFTCMKAAAEAGLAPRLWYTSIEDRISITDFVEAVPFDVSDALVRMPATLRALHSLPPFPGRANHLNTSCMFLINEGPALDGFIQSFRAANLLPTSETDELLAWHSQVCAVYPHDPHDMVSSHNDFLRPENVLFDGHRVWLVDWEAAFLNDRYADLAVVANFIVANDAEEKIYLQEYFGRPPDQYQLARFFLMQQIVHMFYTMGFLLLGSSGKPVNLSEPAPECKAFHRRIWSSGLNLSDKETKFVYGRVHWEQLLQNTRLPRFTEALRIVSDRHGPTLL